MISFAVLFAFLVAAVLLLAFLGLLYFFAWRCQRNDYHGPDYADTVTTLDGVDVGGPMGSRQVENGRTASALAPEVVASHGLNLDESTGPVLKPVDEHLVEHGFYLGTACKLAYGEEVNSLVAFRQQLNLSARLLSVDNTQCYIGENAASIVIAFRGSQKPNSLDGFKDWLLTNARNFLVLPEGRIGTDFAAAGVGARFHRGFMAALDEIWAPLLQSVENALRVRQRPLWITGHSLGGAIALLAAWRLHQHFISVHRICTFGAPMVGNQLACEAYRREFGDRIVRYVDYGDMVPKLPTISLLSNQYQHVEREIILGGELLHAAKTPNQIAAAAIMDRATEQSQTPESDWDEKAQATLWGGLQSGIASHLMDNYIAKIEALS